MDKKDANDLLKKVRKIEIRTRALSHQIFAGEYHSAFKGRGMTFSEVREYQFGDDVRNMDWNVTARMRSPYIKVFEEEREMTVVLLIDISRSGLFGTAGQNKRDMIAEIAAVLSFSAIINNDKVGALFFSDRVEKFIPPKKGRSHLLHIIMEILQFQPEHNGTDIGEALLDVDKDGNPNYEDALKVAVNRHDLSVIEVHDPSERTLPDVGFVHVKDSETMATCWVNTSDRRMRSMYSKWFSDLSSASSRLFLKYKVDNVSISTDSDYVKGLMAFFQRR